MSDDRRELDSLTGDGNYYEDFDVGQRYRHVRGRTVSNTDNLVWTLSTLNTAQAHFNLGYSTGMMDGAFDERLVMGGCTIALVVGLTSEDMAENAVGDLLYDDIRLHTPVYRGDTLYAESEVVELATAAERDDCGEMAYRWRGWKYQDRTVATGYRRILVKRRSHWLTSVES